MKSLKEIVYLKHPVSKNDKAKILKEGKKIIDIKFMPEELKERKESAPKPTPKNKPKTKHSK